MDNLMPDKDRCAKPRQSLFDGSDRPLDPCAEPARLDEKYS